MRRIDTDQLERKGFIDWFLFRGKLRCGGRCYVVILGSVHVQGKRSERSPGRRVASERTRGLLVSRVERRLTKDIGGPVPRDEAGVVAVAHPFLEDPLAKVFAEAIAGADQTVVPTVRLRESAQDSPGYQSAIRKYG